jgi:hypothetical protein
MEIKFVTSDLPGIKGDTLDRSVRADPQQDDWSLWEKKALASVAKQVPREIKFC